MNATTWSEHLRWTQLYKLTYIETWISWLAPQESPVLPTATNPLASSFRSHFEKQKQKSICKVKSKKCERGESCNNIPPLHTGASPGRWVSLQSPPPGWPGSHPTHASVDAYGQAGAIPAPGSEVGSEQCPLSHSPEAHFTGNRHLKFIDLTIHIVKLTLWSAKSHLKSIFHHYEPRKVHALYHECLLV